MTWLVLFIILSLVAVIAILRRQDNSETPEE